MIQTTKVAHRTIKARDLGIFYREAGPKDAPAVLLLHGLDGPVIDRLTRDLEQKHQEVLKRLFSRLNGKLTEGDKEYIAGASRRFQNQLLHGPISALGKETHSESAGGYTLLEALRKLFWLQE